MLLLILLFLSFAAGLLNKKSVPLLLSLMGWIVAAGYLVTTGIDYAAVEWFAPPGHGSLDALTAPQGQPVASMVYALMLAQYLIAAYLGFALGWLLRAVFIGIYRLLFAKA